MNTRPKTNLCPWYADVQARWKVLADMAGGIVPTKLPIQPTPGEIRAVNDDLRTLARHVDALIASYGRYVEAHVSSKIDQSQFASPLSDAIDGNTTFEIDNAADCLREDIMEAAE